MSKSSKSTALSKLMECNHKSMVVLRCKVVLVGDQCVGKSALTQVFLSGGSDYPKNYMMTIGADFAVKQIMIPETSAAVELYIYDCAGQSIFNQLEANSVYYENADAVIAIYDIGNRESFQSCVKWYSAVCKACSKNDSMLGALVGNKADYRDGPPPTRAEIGRSDAVKMAADLRLPYFETSAADNKAIEEPFNFIAKEFYKKYHNIGTAGGGGGSESSVQRYSQ